MGIDGFLQFTWSFVRSIFGVDLLSVILAAFILAVALQLIGKVQKTLGQLDRHPTPAEKYLYSSSFFPPPHTKIYPFQKYHRNWYTRYFFIEVKGNE